MFNPILLHAHNPGPMTGQGNNTYLLIGSDSRAALIDAGVGKSEHLAQLQTQLSHHAATLHDVLVTHAHPDHIKGAPALAAAHEAAVFRKRLWPDEDARHRVEWHPLNDGDQVAAGDAWLTVLYTPGHAPDHVALWHEPTRTAFTGDLVVEGGSVVIEASRGGDLGQYLASLERLLALGPRRLLPGHGPEVTDPAARLHGCLEHRRRRERQVIEALRAGRDTVKAIAESIYHGLAPALVPVACENVRAHLEKLRQEGRALEEDDNRWRMR